MHCNNASSCRAGRFGASRLPEPATLPAAEYNGRFRRSVVGSMLTLWPSPWLGTCNDTYPRRALSHASCGKGPRKRGGGEGGRDEGADDGNKKLARIKDIRPRTVIYPSLDELFQTLAKRATFLQGPPPLLRASRVPFADLAPNVLANALSPFALLRPGPFTSVLPSARESRTERISLDCTTGNLRREISRSVSLNFKLFIDRVPYFGESRAKRRTSMPLRATFRETIPVNLE